MIGHVATIVVKLENPNWGQCVYIKFKIFRQSPIVCITYNHLKYNNPYIKMYEI